MQPLIQAFIELFECSIAVWQANTNLAEKRKLHWVVKTADRVIGSDLPSMDVIFMQASRRKPQRIIRNIHHLPHVLFQWVDLGYKLRQQELPCFSTQWLSGAYQCMFTYKFHHLFFVFNNPQTCRKSSKVQYLFLNCLQLVLSLILYQEISH